MGEHDLVKYIKVLYRGDGMKNRKFYGLFVFYALLGLICLGIGIKTNSLLFFMVFIGCEILSNMYYIEVVRSK